MYRSGATMTTWPLPMTGPDVAGGEEHLRLAVVPLPAQFERLRIERIEIRIPGAEDCDAVFHGRSPLHGAETDGVVFFVSAGGIDAPELSGSGAHVEPSVRGGSAADDRCRRGEEEPAALVAALRLRKKRDAAGSQAAGHTGQADGDDALERGRGRVEGAFEVPLPRRFPFRRECDEAPSLVP